MNPKRSYASMLRTIYGGLTLEYYDLFLLETCQIETLPDRLDEAQMFKILSIDPTMSNFFQKKCPEIGLFVTDCLAFAEKNHSDEGFKLEIQDVLWEIGDLIIYNKFPEEYDNRSSLSQWDIKVISELVDLKDKIILDVGAGTGNVSFKICNHAKLVYAVEPLKSFRNIILEKSRKADINNIIPICGKFASIPLPDNFADVLITFHAIGWDLENELIECERVLRKGGYSIHLTGYSSISEDNNVHKILVSNEWGYTADKYEENNKEVYRYWKKV